MLRASKVWLGPFCLSLRLSHSAALSNQCKLDHGNFTVGYHKDSCFCDKILISCLRGFLSNEGVKKGYPQKVLFYRY